MLRRCSKASRFFSERASTVTSSVDALYLYLVLYREPPRLNPTELAHRLGTVRVGVGYVGYSGRRPKDFTRSNFLPLEDAHSMLLSIIFPDSVPDAKGFRIRPDDRRFLLRYLSRYPREADYPRPPGKLLPDSFKKYFIYGAVTERIANDRLRIFNVVGKSFGFLSETAYVVDFEKNVEFFLSAVIYVNRDGVLNDGKYEYETVGLPFLANFGKVVYAFEAARKKEIVPDLTPFDLLLTETFAPSLSLQDGSVMPSSLRNGWIERGLPRNASIDSSISREWPLA